MGPFFRKWGLALLMIAAIGFFIGFGIRRRKNFQKENIFVELKAIQTSRGWGYDILRDGRVYIHQDIIPDINGLHGFQSKEDALAVGQKVYDRLIKDSLPIVSIEEMRQLGVKLPDSSKK